MDWIEMAQDNNQLRALIKLWVLQNIGKILSGCTTGGFSRSVQAIKLRNKLTNELFS
jgi:hypothetical protein